MKQVKVVGACFKNGWGCFGKMFCS